MLVCGNTTTPGGDPLEIADEKYRNGLINTATYINMLSSQGLTPDEIEIRKEQVRPNRLWETRADCD